MMGIKRSRAVHTGALSRNFGRLKAMPFDTIDEVQSLKTNDIKSILKSLAKTEAGLNQSIEEAQDFAPTEEEAAILFQEEEQETVDTFLQTISESTALGEQLLACKTTLTSITAFKSGLEALQRTLETEPDQDKTTPLGRLQTLFASIREQWTNADLSPDHPLHIELNDCEMRFTQIEADAMAARQRSLPPPSPSTSSFSTSFASSAMPAHKYIELPKIKVPTFTGNIMGWSTFWSTFQSTVDDRVELSDSQKLNYLRQSVTDPSLQLLLNSPMETPDTYKDIVRELKDRFQKTREIHQALVKTITTMSSPKYTRADLRRTYDILKTAIANLKSTKHYTIEAFLSSLLYAILPTRLQTPWDQATKTDKGVPPIEQLLSFIKDHAETLPAANPTTDKTPDPASKGNSNPKRKDASSYRGKGNVHVVSPAPTQQAHQKECRWECKLCPGEKHLLYFCPKWTSFSLVQKTSHIGSHKLCSNCLGPGHTTVECRSLYRCRECRQKHHSSIHQPQSPPVNSISSSQQVPDALLTTAEVLLHGPNGEALQARALIDSGAGLSLITNRVAQLLNLPLEPARLQLTVAQGKVTKPLKHVTNLQISPLHDRTLKMPCLPAVADTVTAIIPSQPISPVTDMTHLLGLQLADTTYNVPGTIDILLGADMASLIISPNDLPRRGKTTEPIAQSTIFGWTLSGPVPGFGRNPDAAPILLPLIQTKPSSPSEPHLDDLPTTTTPVSQTQGDQQIETETCSTQDAALSPAGSPVDKQQSSRVNHANLYWDLFTKGPACYSQPNLLWGNSEILAEVPLPPTTARQPHRKELLEPCKQSQNSLPAARLHNTETNSHSSNDSVVKPESQQPLQRKLLTRQTPKNVTNRINILDQDPAALQPNLPTFSSAECQTPQQICSPPTSTKGQPLALTPAHHIQGRIVLPQTISAECQTLQQIPLPQTTTAFRQAIRRKLSRENAPSLLTGKMDTAYLTQLILHHQPTCQSLLINILMSTNRVSIDPATLHYQIDASIYLAWLQDQKQQISVISNYSISILQAPKSITWKPRPTALSHLQLTKHGLLKEQSVVILQPPPATAENDCSQPLDILENLLPEVSSSTLPKNHFSSQPVQTMTRSIGTLVTRRLYIFLLMCLYLTQQFHTSYYSIKLDEPRPLSHCKPLQSSLAILWPTALLQAALFLTVTSQFHLFQGHRQSFDATDCCTYKWYQPLGQSNSTETDPNLLLLSARRLSRSSCSYQCWENLPYLHHFVDEVVSSRPTENTILSFCSKIDPTDFWKKLSHVHYSTTSETCLNSRLTLPLTCHLTGKDKLDRAVTSRTAARTLTTIICRIEACLNSRPLLPITSHSPDGLPVLTAGHFLTGRSPSIYPEDPAPLDNLRLLQKWNLCQGVVQQFWTRWSKEYLNSLQARTKWQSTTANLQVDDVVAIKPMDKFLPCHWPLGRVSKTMPGKDGRVRVVELQTPTGYTQRARARLALIYRPGEEEQPRPREPVQTRSTGAV